MVYWGTPSPKRPGSASARRRTWNFCTAQSRKSTSHHFIKATCAVKGEVRMRFGNGRDCHSSYAFHEGRFRQGAMQSILPGFPSGLRSFQMLSHAHGCRVGRLLWIHAQNTGVQIPKRIIQIEANRKRRLSVSIPTASRLSSNRRLIISTHTPARWDRRAPPSPMNKPINTNLEMRIPISVHSAGHSSPLAAGTVL